jgi:hypothetical protein
MVLGRVKDFRQCPKVIYSIKSPVMECHHILREKMQTVAVEVPSRNYQSPLTQ